MKKTPSLPAKGPILLGSLGLAALGQSFLFQREAPWTLGVGLALYAMAIPLFLYGVRPQKEAPSPLRLSPRVEWGLFGSILLLAFLLRVYRLGSLPPGIFLDEGFVGWGALRILHEGWRPYGTMPIILTWPAILYQCAAWFLLVKPTSFTLLLFFVMLALGAFPLIYLFLRRLAGAPTALLALFFLAVMYWHLNACRNGFISNQVYLYQFAALCLLLYGLKTSKGWAFAAAGLVFAAGLYGYQSFKVFPLLVALYLAYESRSQPAFFRRYAMGLALFGLVFLAFSLPVAYDWFTHGFFSSRDDAGFIGRAIREQKSLRPLWDSAVRTLLLFNRSGDDPLTGGTFDGRAMLDPVTGVLFLFGFFNALRSPLRRDHFYGLCGLGVLGLPAFLSIGQASHRIVGLLPFVAFFSAQALVLLWDRAVAPSKAWVRGAWGALAAGALLFAGAYNAWLYFAGQARNGGLWAGQTMDANLVAQAVLAHPDADFCLPPYYFQDYTVRYLTYFHQHRVHPMDIPSGLTPSFPFERPWLCFAVEKRKAGWMGLLQSLYPGGRVEEASSPQGEALASFYYVPSKTVEAARGVPRNGAFHGAFRAQETGTYRFFFSGGTHAWLAHRPVVPSAPLSLVEGFYAFDLAAPHGAQEPPVSFKDPEGAEHPLDSQVLTTLPLAHGLFCRYACSDPPLLFTRWDPLVDLMSIGDLPYPTSFFSFAQWDGRLDCPRPGAYDFLILAIDQGMLWVDGKPVIDTNKGAGARRVLAQGPHSIRLVLTRKPAETGVRLDYHFLWKKPGDRNYGVVPNSAFGETGYP